MVCKRKLPVTGNCQQSVSHTPDVKQHTAHKKKKEKKLKKKNKKGGGKGGESRQGTGEK